jgi:hypothetical protein
VLAHAAFAEGVIHPSIVPPPPPTPSSTCGGTHPGSIDPGEEPVDDDGTVEWVTEVTLSIVRNLLALF